MYIYFYFSKLSFTVDFCLNISWTICPPILLNPFWFCLMMPWLGFKFFCKLCISVYNSVLVYCPRTTSLRLSVSIDLLIKIERFFIEKVRVEGHSWLDFCFLIAARLIFYPFGSEDSTIGCILTFLNCRYILLILRLFLLTLLLLTPFEYT